MIERQSYRPVPVDAATTADMDEQAQLLREAFADNRANALGVVAAELKQQQRIVDGTHPDERLKTEAERAKAAYRLEKYRELEAEFQNNS